MAEGSVTRPEASKAAEAPHGGLPAGWRRALTLPLGFFSGFAGSRYASSIEVSAAAKAARGGQAAQSQKSLWGRFTGALTSLKDSVIGAFGAVRKAIQEKGVLGAIGDLASAAWNGMKAAGNRIMERIVGTARSLIDTASRALSAIAGFMSKVWTAFTAHNREIERRIDEQKREQERLEERRIEARRDESRHLEEAVARARAVAQAQEFQAQQGLIDKITVTTPNSQLDNAALERKRERERAHRVLPRKLVP